MNIELIKRKIELKRLFIKSIAVNKSIKNLEKDELEKAHSHKYIKKVGTGDTAKYFYRVNGKIMEGDANGPKEDKLSPSSKKLAEDIAHVVGEKHFEKIRSYIKQHGEPKSSIYFEEGRKWHEGLDKFLNKKSK